MCLTIVKDDGGTLYSRPPKPRIAKKGIFVVKQLIRRNRLKSPYQGMHYHLGKTYRVGYLETVGSGYSRYEVYQGLHSYTRIREDTQFSQYLAVIPKGSKYYRGQSGQIVSTRLKVIRRLTVKEYSTIADPNLIGVKKS